MATPTSQANGHADASASASIPSTTTPAAGSAQTSKIQPNDVGWQFVPQYYNFVNKQPHRLHCFYNKRSTFIHGEEGEESQIALGQQEIHDRITAIGYDECKVYIHSIDSQSSANGGIIILVIGEMSNKDSPWRKFTQTFFLAEQPNGYFVLNDIFRYLKEDVDEKEDVEEEQQQQQPQALEQAAPVAVAEQAAAPAAPAKAPEPQPAVEVSTPAEQVTQEPAKAPEPEPEPVSAPAEVVKDAVPEEAQVASVPDKDVAPAEPAPAIEEPVTSAPAAAKETPAPAPAPAAAPAAPAAKPAASPAPAAAAPKTNGSAPSAPAPAAAPAQPAAPPKPKTWASLAASGKAWSSAVVSNQAASSSPAPSAAAAAPKKEETPAPAAAAPSASTSTEGKHQFYVNATRVNTPHCFVKLPNWSLENQGPTGEVLSENEVKNIAARFGDVKKVEIVKAKACAFVEFARVDSARKAIIASLPASQGGEDGVKFDGGRLNFETRKEKDERRPKGGAGGQSGAGGQAGPRASEGGRPRVGGQGQGQPNGGERGGQGGARGGRGPRGRGGQGNQGDRVSSAAK
ncbi:RAN protein binding protein [Kwoniella heveanensis CBS 569]|nr:RAN protein binding protein [Kwoniella heveanensis CBS 569]